MHCSVVRRPVRPITGSGDYRCLRRLLPTRRPAPTSSAVPATARAPPASTPVRASEPPPACVPGPGGTLPPGGVLAGEPVGDGVGVAVPQLGHRGVVEVGDGLEELVDGDADGLELGVPHSEHGVGEEVELVDGDALGDIGGWVGMPHTVWPVVLSTPTTMAWSPQTLAGTLIGTVGWLPDRMPPECETMLVDVEVGGPGSEQTPPPVVSFTETAPAWLPHAFTGTLIGNCPEVPEAMPPE